MRLARAMLWLGFAGDSRTPRSLASTSAVVEIGVLPTRCRRHAAREDGLTRGGSAAYPRTPPPQPRSSRVGSNSDPSGAGRSSSSSGQVGRRSRQTLRARRVTPGRPCRGGGGRGQLVVSSEWISAPSRNRRGCVQKQLGRAPAEMTRRYRRGAIACGSAWPRRRGFGFHFRRGRSAKRLC